LANEPKIWTSREAYLLAMVTLFTGLIAGYLFRGSSSPTGTMPPPAASTAVPPSGESMQSPRSLDQDVQPLLNALKLNPQDAQTLARVGDAYYDHKFWPEAIKYYQQALEIRPNDLNVRTDMGTAYFYSGFPDKAVEEFNKVLKIQPNYPNTLFNLGVVRRDSYKDNAGALAAWEKLLKNNPKLPPDQVQKVQNAIAELKSGKS
jgi:tetratricopeptide (TPR) repeat protein